MNQPQSKRAVRPRTKSDRRFYSAEKAFGRFGVRLFRPQTMAEPHSHGHIEFNWLTAGETHYAIDGREILLPAGKLMAFWAGIPHQVHSIDCPADARQLNIYLPMDAFLEMSQLGELTDTLMGGGVIILPPECAGLETLQRWYGDYRSGDPIRSDLARAEIGTMLRRATLLSWETTRTPWDETTSRHSQTSNLVRYAAQMVRHIVENASSQLSVKDVAQVAGLHPNYAAVVFSKVMHTSINKFILRMRLIRARSLLFNTDLSVANIAFQAGFASQSQFFQHFRTAYGLTPLQMRNSTQIS